MDVKCGGCNQSTTIFSHAQSTITCEGCKNILCKPTGGKVKLTEGSAFKVKAWELMLFNTYLIIKHEIDINLSKK